MQPDEPDGPEAIQRAWRKAVRQLAESTPGSPENDRLAARVRDLAAEYRASIEAQTKHAKAKGRRTLPGHETDPDTTSWSHVEPRDVD
jgi:hypothetical protein